VYGGLWRKLPAQFADPPALYAIYIGKADFFHPHIRLFENRLTQRGYPHQFTLVEGGHEWYNWIDFLNDFCERIF